MKTNLAELGQIYKNYLEDNKPSSRNACPPPEKLMLLVRSKRIGLDQKKLLDHAIKCAYCQREIKGLLDITKAEDTFVFEMGELRNSADVAAHPQARPLARRWSWNPVSLISAIVIVTAIATFSIIHFSSRSDYRRGPTAGIRLISPVEKAVASGELRFVWAAVPRAKYYTIETLDVTLDLISRNEFIAATEFRPSQDIIQKFRPNEKYYWRVTAVFEGGNKTNSGMKEFSIRN